MSQQKYKTSIKQLQAQCDRFNERVKVGDSVIVTMDGGKELTTRTRSEAQILSGHSAVVWMDDVRGCYLLERVRAAS